MNPRFAVLFGSDDAVIDRLEALSLSIVLFTMTPTPASNAKLIVFHVVGNYVSICDIVGFVDRMVGLDKVDLALSADEMGLSPAAQVNAALGRPAAGQEVVALTRDKSLMRSKMTDFSIPAVMVSSTDELIAFGRAVGWPIITKPSNGSGSARVRLVNSESHVTQDAIGDGFVLAERYLEGRLLCIDCLSRHGNIAVMSVAEEFLNKAGRFGSNPWVKVALDSPASLSPAELSLVNRVVINTLMVLGVDEGPSHTEVILSGTNAYVLETHTRFGTDIPRMVMKRSGVDLQLLSICHLTGKSADLPKIRPTGACHVRYFVTPPGHLSAITGLARARQVPFVVDVSSRVKAGDFVPPLNSDEYLCGSVFAHAPTLEAARLACVEAQECIGFEYR